MHAIDNRLEVFPEPVDAANARSITITIPAAVQTGDCMIVAYSYGDNGTVTAPAGWSEIQSSVDNTNFATYKLYYRVAVSTDTSGAKTYQ
jgi:hypothetical protein